MVEDSSGSGAGPGSGRGRSDGGLGDLGRNERGDIVLGDRGGGGDASLDDTDDAPAFQAAERTGLHDLDLVTDLDLVLLVVDVQHRLAVDDLVVERMRRLVGDRDFDGFVAGTTADEAE